jgi:hypothetical protein
MLVTRGIGCVAKIFNSSSEMLRPISTTASLVLTYILSHLNKQIDDIFSACVYIYRSRDSSGGITTGYGLDGCDSIRGRAANLFSSRQH